MRGKIIALLGLVLLGTIAAVLVYAQCAPSVGTQLRDEFNGPFADWVSVKTGLRVDGTGGSVCTGATGNGSTDDTTALQSCLTAMQSSARTLYFPAGTYKISSTLTFSSTNTGNTFIGHNPADTTIAWFGSAGTDMWDFPSGLHYGSIGRLTFNGNAGGNTAGAILNDTGASSGGEGRTYFDLVLENATTGWTDNASAPNNADSMYLRDTFTNLTQGVWTQASNTLDEYVFDSTFVNNGIALRTPSKGTIYAIDDVFVGSTTVDYQGNNSSMSARGNVSTGSAQFYSTGSNGIGRPYTFVGNRILNTTNACAISANMTGALTALKNQIVSKAGNTTAPICMSNGLAAFGHANQFTVAGTNGTNGSTSWFNLGGSSPRLIESGDSQVAANTISTGCPFTITSDAAGNAYTQNLATGTCYPTPPNISRLCYAGGTSHTCGTPGSQETSASNLAADITAACPANYTGGNRPIINLSAATFSIGSTLTIPGFCDVQIVGSGWWSTTLSWSGGASGTMISGSAPSTFSVTTLQLQGNGNLPKGIVVTSEDTGGANSSRVQFNTLYAEAGVVLGIFANHLANTLVDINAPSSLTNVPGGAGINVNGTGVSGTPSRVGCWACSSGGTSQSSTPVPLNVTNGGNLVMEPGFYSTIGGGPNDPYNLVNLTSSSGGTVSIDGVVQQVWLSGEAPIITVNNFPGTFTLASSVTGGVNGAFGQWAISNMNGPGTAFLVDNLPTSPNPGNSTTATAFAQLANNVSYSGGSATLLADAGTMSLSQEVAQMSYLENNQPAPDIGLPSGVTDTQITNIRADNLNPILDVEHN